ncbi:MAG: OsmC family protein [Armatimonadota bacterium]
MLITYLGGMKLLATHTGFEVLADQPTDQGGDNAAMTPTQLFVASLAMCVGTYVLFFAKRHSIPVEGMRIETDYQMAKDPYRVGAIQVKVLMPAPVSDAHLSALQRAAETCVVHNAFHHPPATSITVTAP